MKKKENVKKPLYKKWWFWVIVVLVLGAIGAGLSDDEPSEQPSISQTETQVPPSIPEPSGSSVGDPAEATPGPESDPVENTLLVVELSVSAGGDAGKPEFIINTNLPDETELMLSLSGGDYMAQTKVTVENGTAISEAFSDKGEALSGVFSLDVSMSLPRLQPDFVRSVIGEHGENISGQYVEKDDITGENWVNAEAIYEYEF